MLGCGLAYSHVAPGSSGYGRHRPAYDGLWRKGSWMGRYRNWRAPCVACVAETYSDMIIFREIILWRIFKDIIATGVND